MRWRNVSRIFFPDGGHLSWGAEFCRGQGPREKRFWGCTELILKVEGNEVFNCEQESKKMEGLGKGGDM